MQEILAHLRPLSPLASEDEAKDRRLWALLGDNPPFWLHVERRVSCRYECSVPESRPTLGECVGEVTEADLDTGIDQVVSERLDIGA